MEKIDTPTGKLLATSLQSSEGSQSKEEEDVPKGNNVDVTSLRDIAVKDALSQAQQQIKGKDAKIQYLNTLIKELKALYTSRLEVKDLELATLRAELEKTVKELAMTKKSLTEAIEGHAKLVDDVTKKSKEDLCWFSPVLGTLQFN